MGDHGEGELQGNPRGDGGQGGAHYCWTQYCQQHVDLQEESCLKGGLRGGREPRWMSPSPRVVPGRLPDSDLGKMNEFLDLNFLESFSFPGGSDHKESTCKAGDLALIPGLGRSPGEGNSMDKGAWKATVHGISKSWTQLSEFQVTFTLSLKPRTRY